MRLTLHGKAQAGGIEEGRSGAIGRITGARIEIQAGAEGTQQPVVNLCRLLMSRGGLPELARPTVEFRDQGGGTGAQRRGGFELGQGFAQGGSGRKRVCPTTCGGTFQGGLCGANPFGRRLQFHRRSFRCLPLDLAERFVDEFSGDNAGVRLVGTGLHGLLQLGDLVDPFGGVFEIGTQRLAEAG